MKIELSAKTIKALFLRDIQHVEDQSLRFGGCFCVMVETAIAAKPGQRVERFH